MKVSADQIVRGIIKYADNEVVNNLPTPGKWLIGTGVGVVSTKANEMIDKLNHNSLVHTMGIIDDNGMYDIDLIMDSMHSSASKYGKLTYNIPFIGMISFTENDVESLKGYIERG